MIWGIEAERWPAVVKCQAQIVEIFVCGQSHPHLLKFCSKLDMKILGGTKLYKEISIQVVAWSECS